MNLFFDKLPNEIQSLIYEFDTTYYEIFNKVIKELNYKHDLASSCGYEFPGKSIDFILQKLYRRNQIYNIQTTKNKPIIKKSIHICNCYFCREIFF